MRRHAKNNKQNVCGKQYGHKTYSVLFVGKNSTGKENIWAKFHSHNLKLRQFKWMHHDVLTLKRFELYN